MLPVIEVEVMVQLVMTLQLPSCGVAAPAGAATATAPLTSAAARTAPAQNRQAMLRGLRSILPTLRSDLLLPKLYVNAARKVGQSISGKPEYLKLLARIYLGI